MDEKAKAQALVVNSGRAIIRAGDLADGALTGINIKLCSGHTIKHEGGRFTMKTTDERDGYHGFPDASDLISVDLAAMVSRWEQAVRDAEEAQRKQDALAAAISALRRIAAKTRYGKRKGVKFSEVMK